MLALHTAATTAEQVAALARRLYGPVDFAAATGVIHPVATWVGPDGTRRVIAIGPAAPRSATDFFVLNLARARADVIVTTGKILRDEPTLRYDLQGDTALGLAAWRREVLGKSAPPRVAVLTSGRDLDLDHPSFSSGASLVVVTSTEAAARLEGESPARVEIVGRASTSIRDTIAWARSTGAATISVEAGPRTAAALYASPLAVDELLRSTYRAASLDPAAHGPAFVPDAAIAPQLQARETAVDVDEASGPWRFERFVRTAAP